MASFKYNNVYINDFYSIAGPVEKAGKIKNYDETIDDYYWQEKNFENCEVKMQKRVMDSILKRNKLSESLVDLVVGGDLLNQISSTSYNIKEFQIPFIGVYCACAIFPSSLIILANFIEGQFINNGIAITSSHNLNSEKQFRFPVEYGAPKPLRTTFTATGAAAMYISNKKSKYKIESGTIGKVIDFGQKDVFNMGAIMAPAVASVLISHLTELKRSINYYDLILTGDLGLVGVDILKEYLKINNKIRLKNHIDAGTQLYNYEKQEVYSGASGPVVLPLYLFNKILKVNKYKKILIIGTGSLHSLVMVNEKNTVPAIAHAVSLEVK